MPISSEKFNTLSTKGDVAGVAIATMVALGAVTEALEAIELGQPLAPRLKTINDSINEMRKMFNELVMEDE